MGTPITTTDIPIISEEKLFRRYITVYNRTIRQPSGLVSNWDVVGHDDGTGRPAMEANFVAVFPWFTASKTTALVREYAQGPHEMLYTVACGAYDRAKHTSPLHAAQSELSEESRLTGGTYIALSDLTGPGIAELKWSANRFHVFLCVDPVKDEHPGARDAEEIMDTWEGVTVPDLKAVITRGKMLLPSVQASWMAVEYLEKNGML
ncbi:hypothetical protein M427DRAFT_51045 [Gonapodya prolifera JEL478]|uniref:Nudix hydrolase domain-containing protein n=1 Tax=Gonapodya prolifera (strain JEL478) TaxID=1344416 RepID=A0A139AY09_GONPJ|nr:hypothetical protein M427DRAFT_51045 [Gonapodya prolifera JEL478]|eukprot:KXS21626.1 hypothetical protein M427DRAFT_51045 [Gonapodya prolifera JEL478]